MGGIQAKCSSSSSQRAGVWLLCSLVSASAAAEECVRPPSVFSVMHCQREHTAARLRTYSKCCCEQNRVGASQTNQWCICRTRSFFREVEVWWSREEPGVAPDGCFQTFSWILKELGLINAERADVSCTRQTQVWRGGGGCLQFLHDKIRQGDENSRMHLFISPLFLFFDSQSLQYFTFPWPLSFHSASLPVI